MPTSYTTKYQYMQQGGRPPGSEGGGRRGGRRGGGRESSDCREGERGGRDGRGRGRGRRGGRGSVTVNIHADADVEVQLLKDCVVADSSRVQYHRRNAKFLTFLFDDPVYKKDVMSPSFLDLFETSSRNDTFNGIYRSSEKSELRHCFMDVLEKYKSPDTSLIQMELLTETVFSRYISYRKQQEIILEGPPMRDNFPIICILEKQ